MNQSIIGKEIDGYEITGVLGKGGMGVVYKAKDLTLDRDVALKMMDANFARDEEFLKRFKSEAKALARLQNPNIVTVFALRETELGFCLVMEFVEGNTLADRIRVHGAMPLVKAIPIFTQLTRALDHAHQVGVIHRDIKPSNVMLTTRDDVKVTDFGLAKIQQVASSTVTMGTGGTLYYMSPEQVKGLANVDARGDIYSLGMTLYETVTGRVPFGNNATDFDIRQMIVGGKIPSPENFNPSLPKELAQIIQKSLHRDPAKRFQTCAEMCAVLAEVPIPRDEAGQPDSRVPVRPVIRAQQTSQRKPLYVGLAIGGTLIAALYILRPILFPSSSVLDITSNPTQSRITLNGKVVGTTPLRSFSLDAGAAVLRISKDGYAAKETTLSVREGQSVELSVVLPLTSPKRADTTATSVLAKNELLPTKTISVGKLRARAIPGGSVSVDGGPKSSLTAEGVVLEVQSGVRKVLFENLLYGSKLFTLNLRANETKNVTCYFEAKASIVCSGDATWAYVVHNGKRTDVQTPIAGFTLTPGKHRLTVTRTEYETLESEKEITVEPTLEPNEIRLAFTLKKK